jgi:pimeloyl-ACP methyl ester carboxylesterase
MRTRIALMCAALVGVPSAVLAAKSTGSYAEVNGVRLYYEVHGRGQPLIMLHGGVTPSEQFGPNIEALAKGRKVIAVHLQGHGKSSDVAGPYRFEKLADDIAALAEKLKLTSVDVLGHSFGGGVAWQLAIRHPDLVRKLVIVGEVMKRDGWYPEVVSGFQDMAKDPKKLGAQTATSPLGKQYPNVNWDNLFQKIGEVETQDYDWSASVTALKMPVMLVYSDADAVRSDHIVEIWKALGGGARDPGIDGSLRPKTRRLAILPNTTHYNVMKTTAVAEVVAPFLDDKPATGAE